MVTEKAPFRSSHIKQGQQLNKRGNVSKWCSRGGSLLCPVF